MRKDKTQSARDLPNKKYCVTFKTKIMKKILLLIITFFPLIIFSQTDNKIEGLIINTPCELEYTRNLGNQNNYSCVTQNEYIKQFSVTVQNLFEEMKGLNGDSLKEYKNSFITGAKNNAESNGETVESIIINGKKALKIESYLTYSGHRFKNTSIVLLYKNKSFIVNLTTNDLSNSATVNLSDRIKFK